MPLYSYKCSSCGDRFDDLTRADSLICPRGHKAVRVWSSVNIDAKSARHKGRFDPQVGAYVRNEREFTNLLRQGQEKEANELGMEVKLETIDARDHEGLAELHGFSASERESHLEGTRRAEYDKAGK